MEHYKSRSNDFFHFTNPHDDDGSELDDDDDHDELQCYDVDDDCSCDFNFHTFRPLGITQPSPPNFQTGGVVNQTDTLTRSKEELGTFDNGALIFQIDHTMKNLSDKLQCTIEGIGTQMSHLEDETCKLDKHVEDVKNSAERYHGTVHRKLRQMQSILQEVQDDVLFLRDKQEIAETQLQLAKLQGSKRDKVNAAQADLQQQAPLPAPQSSCHIPSKTPLNQLPSNQAAFAQAVSFPPTVSQAPEIAVQQYLIPPNQQPQTPHPNKSDPQFPCFSPSYQLNSLQGVVSPQNHPFLSHPSPETPSRPSYSYFSSVQHIPIQPARWESTQEREVGLPQLTHVPSSRNYKSEIHAKYMPESASFSNIHPYGKLPYSREIPNVKPVEFSLHPSEPSSRSDYTLIPVARVLPPALLTASDVKDGLSSEENGNTIPEDDIVDKVTAMGFRRDLVRACVRRLAENGSSLDLNVVLDRMMNNK